MSRNFPWLTRLVRGFREQLTPGGKCLVCVLIGTLYGVVGFDMPLTHLFLCLATLWLASGVVGRLYRPRLSACFHYPRTRARGDVWELTYRLTNSGLRPAFEFRVEPRGMGAAWEPLDPPDRPAVSLAVGESHTGTLRFRCLRRGIWPCPALRVTSCFPFNLFRFGQTLSIPGDVCVAPAYRPLSLDVRREVARASTAMEHSQASADGHCEYFGNREYQPGVAVRRWDYAAWARLGKPVIRQYAPPRHPTVALLVDCRILGPQAIAGTPRTSGVFRRHRRPSGLRGQNALKTAPLSSEATAPQLPAPQLPALQLPLQEATLALAAALADCLIAQGAAIRWLALWGCANSPERRSATPAANPVGGVGLPRLLRQLAAAQPSPALPPAMVPTIAPTMAGVPLPSPGQPDHRERFPGPLPDLLVVVLGSAHPGAQQLVASLRGGAQLSVFVADAAAHAPRRIGPTPSGGAHWTHIPAHEILPPGAVNG